MNIEISQVPDILRRRWIYPAVAAAACGVLALAFVMHQTPLYKATVELIVDPAGLQSPATGAAGASASGAGELATDSQIYIMQSAEVLSEVVDALKLQDDGWMAPAHTGGLLSRLLGRGAAVPEDERKQMAIEALRSDITVARAEQSLVFTVTAKHPNAIKAAEIANATADAYLKLTDSGRSGSTQRYTASLQSQADELRQRLQKAQIEIEAYKAAHGLFSSSTKGLVVDQEVENLSQQLATANGKVDSEKAIYDQAVRLSLADIETGAIPEALQSSTLISLRTRYAQLKDTEAQLAANLGEQHPQLKAARSQVASMRQSIIAEMDRLRGSMKNSYLRAQAERDALQARYQGLARQSGESGEARTRLAQMESDADSLKTLYQSYVTKAEDLGGKQSLDTSAARVISQAVPPAKPGGAPKLLTLIAGILLGGILGTALAVLRELLGPSHERTLQRIHEASGIPVVAATADEAKPAGRKLGDLLAFGRDKAPDPAPEPQPEPPVGGPAADKARVTEMILAAFASEENGRANILFYPANGVEGTTAFIHEIALSLVDAGVFVVMSEGHAALRQRHAIVRRGPRVALAHQPFEDVEGWTGGYLQFDPPSERVPLFASRSRWPVFYLLDASGPAVGAVVDRVFDEADAIVTLAHAKTSKSDLSQLQADLKPWEDKLLGMVVTGV